jgi:hypothetical protein
MGQIRTNTYRRPEVGQLKACISGNLHEVFRVFRVNGRVWQLSTVANWAILVPLELAGTARGSGPSW